MYFLEKIVTIQNPVMEVENVKGLIDIFTYEQNTKDYTLVATAVSNIVGCNCRRRSRGCTGKKYQDGGVTSADGGSAGAAATAPSN